MKWFWQKPPKLEVKIQPVFTDVVKSLWRVNMWVVTPQGVGILFTIGNPCIVHLVDENGLTINTVPYTMDALRQATYLEIPESRRGDKEIAAKLGYL